MNTSNEIIKMTLYKGDAFSAVVKKKFVEGKIQDITATNFSIKTVSGQTSVYNPTEIAALKIIKSIRINSVARIQNQALGNYGGRSPEKKHDEDDYDIFTATDARIVPTNSDLPPEYKLVLGFQVLKTIEETTSHTIWRETVYKFIK